MDLKFSPALLTLAICILFIMSTDCHADENVGSLPTSQGQHSSDDHQGYSIIVKNYGNLWLRIVSRPSPGNVQGVEFFTTQGDTYSLYCPADHHTNTMPTSDDGTVGVFIILTPFEMETKCIKMHIVGDLINPKIAIAPNILSSCQLKYFTTQITDDPRKAFANWTNKYSDLRILMAMSLDNARGEVSCYGDAALFDLDESFLSLTTGNQSFMSPPPRKDQVNGLNVIQGPLGRRMSAILDLKQAKCTMCFKRIRGPKRNGKNINKYAKNKRNGSRLLLSSLALQGIVLCIYLLDFIY